MKQKEIAEFEGISLRKIQESIRKGIKNLKKFLNRGA